MTETEQTQTPSKPTLRSKLLQNKKPLIAIGALVGGGLLAMKFIKTNDLVKIDIVQMVDQELDLEVRGNDLFIIDAKTGEARYVVQYLEPTDGGSNIDWRTIEQLAICPDHGDGQWYCLIMIAAGQERHARYFVCKKV